MKNAMNCLFCCICARAGLFRETGDVLVCSEQQWKRATLKFKEIVDISWPPICRQPTMHQCVRLVSWASQSWIWLTGESRSMCIFYNCRITPIAARHRLPPRRVVSCFLHHPRTGVQTGDENCCRRLARTDNNRFLCWFIDTAPQLTSKRNREHTFANSGQLAGVDVCARGGERGRGC